MTLLSASDDLRYRTLTALNSVLERFAYVVSLRDSEGQYRHWGLSRIYGQRVANDAAAEIHTQLWLEVLRTPIPKLQRELQDMDSDKRDVVLTTLKSSGPLSKPANIEGGGARHFSSVLSALDCLEKAKAGTHQVA